MPSTSSTLSAGDVVVVTHSFINWNDGPHTVPKGAILLTLHLRQGVVSASSRVDFLWDDEIVMYEGSFLSQHIEKVTQKEGYHS
jgi:hypothetical protein